MELLQNTTFWVAVAFILFFALVWFKGRSAIAGSLDEKIATIRNELETAEQLRNEANEALSKAKQRKQNSSTQAKEIIDQAKADVKLLKASATKRHKLLTERREQQLADRIDQLERSATQTVRQEMADRAVRLATIALEQKLQKTGDQKLVANAVDQINQFSKSS